MNNHIKTYRKISIHALLAESDLKQFVVGDVMGISIHALLAESDGAMRSTTGCPMHFYPRSPCGERPSIAGRITSKGIFLSTLSLRRATGTLRTVSVRKIFLSTLSLRRATHIVLHVSYHKKYFYPRSPCGERHAPNHNSCPRSNFYPRSPCGERQIIQNRPCPSTGIFLSTLSLRRATNPKSTLSKYRDISIHALLAESDYLLSDAV